MKIGKYEINYKEINPDENQGMKYELEEDLVIDIVDLLSKKTLPGLTTFYFSCLEYRFGIIKIAKGFRWDGTSGPSFDTKNGIVSSCVHDAFYRCLELSLFGTGDFKNQMRKNADVIFKHIMYNALEHPTILNKIRVNYHFYAVRFFGGNHV